MVYDSFYVSSATAPPPINAVNRKQAALPIYRNRLAELVNPVVDQINTALAEGRLECDCHVRTFNNFSRHEENDTLALIRSQIESNGWIIGELRATLTRDGSYANDYKVHVRLKADDSPATSCIIA